jgi:hypothetical protein
MTGTPFLVYAGAGGLSERVRHRLVALLVFLFKLGDAFSSRERNAIER